jgi:hypothetical protein
MNEEMIAAIGLVLVCGIPIIAILTHHQRKMAELIHRNHNEVHPVVVDEVNKLRAEVQHLRERLNETTIALDDARRGSADIEQRVGDR